MRISIVGAGRMGTALGRAFRRAGHRIEVVVTRSAKSAPRAAKMVGRGALALTKREVKDSSVAALTQLSKSDLILISTPDDTLEHAAQTLARVLAANPKNRRDAQRVALHTSGALSSEVLAPLRKAGVAVGSLHPLVSIAGFDVANDVFDGAFFCVEGDRQAVTTARALVANLNGRSFTIPAKAKPLYHAAAVMSSGYLVALFDVALELLRECGLSSNLAQQVLLPLLKSAAGNLATKTPAQALTGPIARGDVETTRRHLAVLESSEVAEAAALYSVLGRHALRLARRNKPDRKDLKAIAKLLSPKLTRVS